MAQIKKWWQNYSAMVILLTALSLCAGLFIYMGTNYTTVRETTRVEVEMDQVDHKVYMITETLQLVHKEMSNVKTMVTMLNANVCKRLDSLDRRLDRIDDRLSRLEGRLMSDN